MYHISAIDSMNSVKIFLVVSMFLLLCSAAVGQEIVSAPVVETELGNTNATLTTQVSIQSTMSSVMASMEEAERRFKAAMEDSKWMQNMGACRRLVTMVETLICTSKDLNAKMTIAGNSCLYSFKYDMMLVKIQMSSDYLGIILSSVSMSVAERAQTFKDATESFEQSQNMIIEMNNSLDYDIKVAALRQKVIKEMKNDMALDRSQRRQ